MTNRETETVQRPLADSQNASAAPTSTTRFAGILLSLLLAIGGMGYVDCITGFELSFFVFYFAPIAYGAWRLGLLPGLVLSVCSAVSWALADSFSGHTYSNPAYAVWSTLARLTAFLIVAWLTAKTTELLTRERIISAKLRASLAEIKVLQGLLPICAECKKIRDEGGEWVQMEGYIQSHTTAKFSHGFCPQCAKKWLRDAGLDQVPDET